MHLIFISDNQKCCQQLIRYMSKVIETNLQDDQIEEDDDDGSQIFSNELSSINIVHCKKIIEKPNIGQVITKQTIYNYPQHYQPNPQRANWHLRPENYNRNNNINHNFKQKYQRENHIKKSPLRSYQYNRSSGEQCYAIVNNLDSKIIQEQEIIIQSLDRQQLCIKNQDYGQVNQKEEIEGKNNEVEIQLNQNEKIQSNEAAIVQKNELIMIPKINSISNLNKTAIEKELTKPVKQISADKVQQIQKITINFEHSYIHIHQVSKNKNKAINAYNSSYSSYSLPRLQSKISRPKQKKQKIKQVGQYPNIQKQKKVSKLQKLNKQLQIIQKGKQYPYRNLIIEFECKTNIIEATIKSICLNSLDLDVVLQQKQQLIETKSEISNQKLKQFVQFKQIYHNYPRQYNSKLSYESHIFCTIRALPHQQSINYLSHQSSNKINKFMIHIKSIELKCFCNQRNVTPMLSNTQSAQLSCRFCSSLMELTVTKMQFISE